jgi:hypothetical protein
VSCRLYTWHPCQISARLQPMARLRSGLYISIYRASPSMGDLTLTAACRCLCSNNLPQRSYCSLVDSFKPSYKALRQSSYRQRESRPHYTNDQNYYPSLSTHLKRSIHSSCLAGALPKLSSWVTHLQSVGSEEHPIGATCLVSEPFR